jgi:hypothetical protein
MQAMALAFKASQKLDLPVVEQAQRLPDYLADEQRVVQALLDPRQLESLGAGHYRYTVTRVQVFQLQIQPIVELEARQRDGRLELEALDCHLEGLGFVDHFQLTLNSWLTPTTNGLQGEATLAVTVSRPTLLKMIPARVLEATGRSILGGILATIKGRVGQQLLDDFHEWCIGNAEN